jgi:outer membrane protein assembly factor BamB
MNLSRLLPLVLLCSFFLLSDPTQAGDWPRFRGPNGTGISQDKDVPVKWSADNQFWKVEIPGVGNSSPIVSKDRIFVHTSSRDGSERNLLCLDAISGKKLWTKTIAARTAHTHDRNSLASSTPAADGVRVYCAFWDGSDVTLRAFDFSGKELWKYAMGSFLSQHGPGNSPVVHDGKVYFLNDQDLEMAENRDRASVLVCLEATTGKKLWEKTREAYRACYSAPFILEKPGGKTELLVTTTTGITAYDPAEGTVIWNFKWKFDRAPLRTVASSVLSQDMIVASSGDGRGDRHFIVVKLGEKGNISKANVMWELKRNRWMPYVPCALALGEHVYTVNDDGFAACHVAKTGKEVWRERLGSPVTASPVMIDGKIYVIGDKGKVFVQDAAPTFKLLATNDVGEPVSASPAVADGKLYVRGKNHLICIGKK